MVPDESAAPVELLQWDEPRISRSPSQLAVLPVAVRVVCRHPLLSASRRQALGFREPLQLVSTVWTFCQPALPILKSITPVGLSSSERARRSPLAVVVRPPMAGVKGRFTLVYLPLSRRRWRTALDAELAMNRWTWPLLSTARPLAYPLRTVCTSSFRLILHGEEGGPHRAPE